MKKQNYGQITKKILKDKNPFDMSLNSESRIELGYKLGGIFSDLAYKALEEAKTEINKIKNPSFLFMSKEYEKLKDSNTENQKEQIEVLEKYISSQVDIFNQILSDFQDLYFKSIEMKGIAKNNRNNRKELSKIFDLIKNEH